MKTRDCLGYSITIWAGLFTRWPIDGHIHNRHIFKFLSLLCLAQLFLALSDEWRWLPLLGDGYVITENDENHGKITITEIMSL